MSETLVGSERPYYDSVCFMGRKINSRHVGHCWWNLQKSSNIRFVVWKTNKGVIYPIPERTKSGFYVVGLSGVIRNVSEEGQDHGKGHGKITWEIREDWDPGKGYHVNLSITAPDGTKKYAFVKDPSMGSHQHPYEEFLNSCVYWTKNCGCYKDVWEGNLQNLTFNINTIKGAGYETDEKKKKDWAEEAWDEMFSKEKIFEGHEEAGCKGGKECKLIQRIIE